MSTDPDDHPLDVEAAFVSLSGELARGLGSAIDPWVRRIVGERLGNDRVNAALCDGVDLDDLIDAAARAAGSDLAPLIRSELARDADEQRVNPLALARRAVPYATAVLVAVGAPTPARDALDIRAFPDDLYQLSPARFADIDPDLHDLGLAWGAARALVHRRRHG